MNITEARKRQLLVLLLLLLCGSIFYQFPRERKTDAPPGMRPRTAPAASKKTKPQEVLDTALLENGSPRFLNEKRNIFQFKQAQINKNPAQAAAWLKPVTGESKPVI